ncbi:MULTISPECIES: isoprenyl transferase [Prosthecochloris]|uniref:Isoprenyl transferase n=1 Tax=Prosthecochloris marina TaxID=2017681 RepID=A0A317T9W9_9CHLB|nr:MULTISPECIES: isoprenyl transferase [Prosthecochloris]PWW82296.1 di-trans,poly-cis-decaprenylcistransferase [Prosthecochloris marina]UZJ37259.1 isoprenyl transferase [Prosthecochloris sp. SCSIO W1103]UZJ39071.1 isoprenyl transferase [Prosthecochloris sp. SCSIO W1102]
MDFSAAFTSRWFKSATDPQDEQIRRDLKATCELPEHVAIIMDGNGRWARQKGKTRIEGHAAGVDAVRDVVEAAAQLDMQYLTLFTFSTENWKRPEKEISSLMQLLIKVLQKEAKELYRNNVRLHVIGDIQQLPGKVRDTLEETVELTKDNTGLTLCIALSYSGKWDILQACKTICHEIESGRLTSDEIDERLLESFLSTKGIPEPELLIRTSGEFRISNFLLWQSAYSEIYFTNTYWPDFRRSQLYDAIRDFQKRERRFGLTSEQLKSKKALPSRL